MNLVVTANHKLQQYYLNEKTKTSAFLIDTNMKTSWILNSAIKFMREGRLHDLPEIRYLSEIVGLDVDMKVN